MQFKSKLMTVAGAVALALSSSVFAGNVIGTGDIYLSVDDTTSGASYLLDTGISASSFLGTSSTTPITLSGTNYTNFENSITSYEAANGGTDVIEYSVFAGTNSTGTTANYEVLMGATALPTAAASGSKIYTAFSNVGNEFASVPAPASGGSLFFSTGGFSYNGLANNINNALGVSDETTLGSTLAFFNEVTNNHLSTTTQGTLTPYAGTWDLVNNVLTYTAGGGTPTVPLPAPLLLLLSGLGMMGLLGRRRSSAGAVA